EDEGAEEPPGIASQKDILGVGGEGKWNASQAGREHRGRRRKGGEVGMQSSAAGREGVLRHQGRAHEPLPGNGQAAQGEKKSAQIGPKPSRQGPPVRPKKDVRVARESLRQVAYAGSHSCEILVEATVVRL